MENNELKEVIRNYILENKEEMYEAPEDDQEDEAGEEEDTVDTVDVDNAGDLISQVQKRNPLLSQQLRRIQNPDKKLKMLDAFTDFLLGVMGTDNLPQGELRNWALRKFQGQTNETEIDEMSTSAGAGTYNSKYAYKIKKKK